MQLNIILLSTPGSPKWSLSLRFPHQNPVYASPLTHAGYLPAHLILLDFITRTVLDEEFKCNTSMALINLSRATLLCIMGSRCFDWDAALISIWFKTCRDNTVVSFPGSTCVSIWIKTCRDNTVVSFPGSTCVIIWIKTCRDNTVVSFPGSACVSIWIKTCRDNTAVSFPGSTCVSIWIKTCRDNTVVSFPGSTCVSIWIPELHNCGILKPRALLHLFQVFSAKTKVQLWRAMFAL